jgi:hypothetical protein
VVVASAPSGRPNPKIMASRHHPRPLKLVLLVSLAGALVAPLPARAQDVPAPGQPLTAPPPGETSAPPPAQTPAAEEDEGDKGGKGDKKKKKKKSAAEASGADGMDPTATVTAGASQIEIRGRVMAPSVYSRSKVEYDASGVEADLNRLSLLIGSARFGLKVEVLDWVSLQIEAELAGRARLRDGFVQLKRKHWLWRAGHFKMPISVFTLESPWTLPLARRGVLNDLLSDNLLLSGRREGVMGQISAGGFLDPALTAGAFRSVLTGVDAGDPIETLAPDEQTVVGRLSVTPAGVEVAAVAQRRVTFINESLRGFWAAGLESTGDFEFERTGLRFWLEAQAGSSWLSYDSAAADVTFLTGRLLGAWRWGGLHRGELYIEPYATVGLLEPDTDVTADILFETMAGVNLGHWRRTRLTVQFEYSEAQRNFPRVYFLGFGQPMLVRHLAALIQLGAAF